jgi:hypothetical protein
LRRKHAQGWGTQIESLDWATRRWSKPEDISTADQSDYYFRRYLPTFYCTANARDDLSGNSRAATKDSCPLSYAAQVAWCKTQPSASGFYFGAALLLETTQGDRVELGQPLGWRRADAPRQHSFTG